MPNALPFRLSVAAALLVSGGVAAAQGAGTVYRRADWPASLTRRSITLPATMIDLKVPVVVNLAKGSEFDPWFIAPAVGLGLTDDLTLRAYTPENGTGFCLAGTAHGCDKTWNDVGAEFLYGVSRTESSQFALRGGFEAYRLTDPLLLALKLGGAYKKSVGNVAFVLGGDLRIGLTERDRNIKETVTLYVEPQLQLAETVALFAELEAELELQPEKNPGTGETPPIGDTLRVPFAVGAEWEPVHRVSLGAVLGFSNLFGKGGDADARELTVFGQIFF